MALSVTYNRIIDLAENFGTRHAQISEFQVGSEPIDIDWKKKTNGVYFLFDITNIVPAIHEITYELSCVFMDINNKGEELVGYEQQTRTNIHNDTMLIALDFISFLRGVSSGSDSTNCVNIYEDIDVNFNTVSIEPFDSKGRTSYVGQALTMSIKAPYDYDRASLPFDITSGAVVPTSPYNVPFSVYVEGVLQQTLNINVAEDETININL